LLLVAVVPEAQEGGRLLPTAARLLTATAMAEGTATSDPREVVRCEPGGDTGAGTALVELCVMAETAMDAWLSVRGRLELDGTAADTVFAC